MDNQDSKDNETITLVSTGEAYGEDIGQGIL